MASELLVEVMPQAADGDLRRRQPIGTETFVSRADEIADAVLQVADRVKARLDAAADDAPAEGENGADTSGVWGLDEVELSFELSLQVGGGIVVTASGSATVAARVKWRKRG
jgi:hypothetical protein